ncbi:MAG: hypothetical protein JSS16_00515 [Proteobacteria bacterium]|jgi:hypothetical protein|nr:hypothetical protein [Pseudomonadota bacterium]
MFRRSRHRRWIALIALLGLLFQQVAMATYVCPIEAREAAAMAASSDMSHCTEPGMADLARCQQHCHPLAQSSDHGTAPTVPPALLPRTTWLRAAALSSVRWTNYVVLGVTARATAPPLNIQHCTFQI